MKKSIFISLFLLVTFSFVSKNASATHVKIFVHNASGAAIAGETVILQTFDGDEWSDIADAVDLGNGYYSFDFDIPAGPYYRVKIGDAIQNLSVPEQDEFTFDFHL